MENSAYVSPPPLPPQAHLSSAAAAAAFQAACNNSTAGMNFQEALLSRMGRGHFGLTGNDMKDHFAGLGLAAAAASGRVTSGLEGFPGGHPLLSHMQPPFGLHPFDPRLPFSTAGAFRPLFGNAAAAAAAAVSAANSNDSNNSSSQSQNSHLQQLNDAFVSSLIHKSFPSAFQPPTSHHNSGSGHIKSGKGSPPTLFSPGQNLYPRSSAGSPGSPSSSPPMSHRGSGKMDENSNTDRHADSVSPISMDSNHHDEDRASKKIRLCGNKEFGCCCPICGMPLRTSDLEAHYTQELEFLAKQSAALLVSQEQKNFRMNSPSASPGGKSQHSPGIGSIEIAPRSRWDTFQRIQRNRQSRIRVKLSRRAGKRPDEILEEDEPINHRHLRQHLQHGPQSASTPAPHGHNNHSHLSNADEEDIDIVGDDPTNNNNNRGNLSLSSSDASRDLQLHVYGPPQFSEADVLNCLSQMEEEEEQTRRETDNYIKTEAQSPDERMKKETEDIAEEIDEVNGERRRKDVEDVETLKAKVKQLEGSSKCSKCVRILKNPVVNVGCWHVQCERCWLTSLATKKCCSLCGMTTVPSDLRKIYL